MIITNLLEKSVSFRETKDAETTLTGKICAIFGENNHAFRVAFVTDNGTFHTAYLSQLTMLSTQNCSLVLFYSESQRIKAIKCIRTVTGLGLREAKELTDPNHLEPRNNNNPFTVVVKNYLTYDEAIVLKKRIEIEEGMECEIRIL